MKVYIVLEHAIMPINSELMGGKDAIIHGTYFRKADALEHRIKLLKKKAHDPNSFGYIALLGKPVRGFPKPKVKRV